METLRYLIATPSDRECAVVASRDDDSLVPLVSVVKLYVLVVYARIFAGLDLPTAEEATEDAAAYIAVC